MIKDVGEWCNFCKLVVKCFKLANSDLSELPQFYLININDKSCG